MTTLYNHIIARFGLNARNLYSWEAKGLPSAWVKALAIQGRLYFHEGAWVLEWDGEEFPITDELCDQLKAVQQKIKTDTQLRASNALKPKQ